MQTYVTRGTIYQIYHKQRINKQHAFLTDYRENDKNAQKEQLTFASGLPLRKKCKRSKQKENKVPFFWCSLVKFFLQFLK